MENYALYIKTADAESIKILLELLSSSTPNLFLEVTNEGIFSKILDKDKIIGSHLLFDVRLFARNFSFYHVQSPIKISINIKQLSKMMKIIKKKLSITLFIDAATPSKMSIDVGGTITHVNVQYDVLNFDIDLPEEYPFFYVISSDKFYRLCKNLGNIGKHFSIDTETTGMVFGTNDEGIFIRNSRVNALYHGATFQQLSSKYDIRILQKILKITRLGKIVKFYMGDDMPLRIESSIGVLGELNTFVKSLN